jgi:AraC-like DNA-binding protein
MRAIGHLRLEELTLLPGQEWSPPAVGWHAVRLAAGPAYWLGRPQPLELAQGEVLILSPRARGLVRASRLHEARLEGFVFKPDLLLGLLPPLERQCFDQWAAEPAQAVRVLSSLHPAAQRFAELGAGQRPGRGLTARAQLLGILGAVFDEELTRQPAPPPRVPAAVHRFEELIARMPEMEFARYSPEQLARLCGCTTRHFGRLFRSQFGKSPRDRQTELRLRKAGQLLVGTGVKVAEVAQESGYRSLSLFNVLFKKHYGMTPSQWRQREPATRAPTRRPRLAPRSSPIRNIADIIT